MGNCLSPLEKHVTDDKYLSDNKKDRGENLQWSQQQGQQQGQQPRQPRQMLNEPTESTVTNVDEHVPRHDSQLHHHYTENARYSYFLEEESFTSESMSSSISGRNLSANLIIIN